MPEEDLKKKLKIVVGQAKLEPGVELLHVIRCIDDLLLTSGELMHKKLRHYLERRSYAKALEYLEGEGIS